MIERFETDTDILTVHLFTSRGDEGEANSAPYHLETINYSTMEATTPAPTVRPPSRMAKRSFSSMAIGTISWTFIVTLSPGITISTPSSSVTTPVTSVVRK